MKSGENPIIRWVGGNSIVVLVALLVVVAGTWGFIALADEVREGDTQRFDDWAIRRLRRTLSLGPRRRQHYGVPQTRGRQPPSMYGQGLSPSRLLPTLE